jgi:hypothetical protein
VGDVGGSKNCQKVGQLFASLASPQNSECPFFGRASDLNCAGASKIPLYEQLL